MKMIAKLDKSTWIYKVDCIVSEGECIYLDNGGCLTYGEISKLFTQMTELATIMAKKLDALGDKPEL